MTIPENRSSDIPTSSESQLHEGRGCHGWEIAPNSKPFSRQRTGYWIVHSISARTKSCIWL